MLIKFGDLKQAEYAGIQEMAAYNLHKDVFDILKKWIKPGMRALDFGCGQGAFSQRLVDAGLSVDVCDLNTEQIKANVKNRYKIDLNMGVQDNIPGRYDLIVALEIIEHLHNPWMYLEDCRSLLSEGGLIILSTPNISNFVSRLRFCMRGTLLAYEKNDLAHGHITPLSYIQLENMFDFFKLRILNKGYAGTIPFFHFYGITRFTLLRNTILPLFYPFMSGPKKGRALVYLLSKDGEGA
ncbi:MAG TPA: class I SAM-dependent methyltransferase [Bacteroidales bacterium]|nr:class I SAM-dependent methyltransferase [Bacteroidales bacterium]